MNTTFLDLGDMTLLCMTFWTLCRRSIASGARKLKLSKANGIKTWWLSEHAFSCLVTLLDATFRAACPTIKGPAPNPTSGETLVKSTQSCFPPTHSYTITSADLSVDLLSSGSVRKFTGASFFTDIPVGLKISKSISLTKSCLYLKPGSSLQWTTCSPKLSRHTLRQTGHTLLVKVFGICKLSLTWPRDRRQNFWMFASSTCSGFSSSYRDWWVRSVYVISRVSYYPWISRYDFTIYYWSMRHDSYWKKQYFNF